MTRLIKIVSPTSIHEKIISVSAIPFIRALILQKYDTGIFPIVTYLIESNDQITKNDGNRTDYLTKDVFIEKENSSVRIGLDMSATGVEGNPEISFRGKVGEKYANPYLAKWVIYYALEKPHAEFLIQNVAVGKYNIGVQWKAITGGIVTSKYHQADSYNRVIIKVYLQNKRLD